MTPPNQIFLSSPLGWGANDSLPYGQAGYDKDLGIDFRDNLDGTTTSRH